MAQIVIDGVTYEVDPDNNLLQECLSQGLDLPYFCWHPCMGSVGACRQCAVKQYKDEDDKDGILVMACMTPATDGAIISIEDQQARLMRERVIESLMISHPHDCPVCEEGGECHLQDMTQMSGHNYRRYDKKKVTHRNQYLGPFINHEMNRCITCYRCVRYYDDYAGGTDLAVQASHHHTYFGRHEEGVLESEFSGNLVEVCPTGVFTDKAFSEHYARKWDLQTAPSVCVGCSVGCNTAPGERYGSLRRIVNRYNSEVNGYFLCDRGRFGFDYVNSEDRLKNASKRVNGVNEELDAEQVAAVIAEYKSSKVIGIGSPRASNESNFALRCFVGEENFYSGLSALEQETVQLAITLAKDAALNTPSIRDIEKSDAILIVNEDVTNTAPRIALALRQSVRNKAQELAQNNHIPSWQDAAVRELAQDERSPLCILSNYASRLDDVASDTVIDTLDGVASIAFAIANKISVDAPAAELSGEHGELVERVSTQLLEAKKPLIIAGSNSIQSIKAAANVARALSSKRSDAIIDLCVIVPEVNSIGLGMLANEANTLDAALERISSGSADHLVVLENDLYRRASHAQVDLALEKATSTMVIDILPTRTTDKADYVLAATAFSEHEATYVNYEGRAQLSFQVHQCNIHAQEGWRWLGEASDSNVESFVNRCSNEVDDFGKLDDLLPDVNQFVAGMKIPRQSHRYSGRTAMKANLNVHEAKQAVDNESVMSFSMEGIPSQKDATILASSWAPKWNSNQSISKFQEEVNGELKQGHTGSLLIEKITSERTFYTPDSKPAEETGLVVAFARQIFGSDELSARSNPIRQRMTDAYIAISPDDANARSLKQGDVVTLSDGANELVVCIRTKIKNGSAVIYCGSENMDEQSVAATTEVNKVAANGSDLTISGLIISDLLEEDY